MGAPALGWRRLIGGHGIYHRPESEVSGPLPRRDTAGQIFELWGALSPAPGGLSARGWRRPRGADGLHQRPEFQDPRPRRSGAGPGRTSNPPLAGGLAQDGAPFPGRVPISAAARFLADISAVRGSPGLKLGGQVEGLGAYRTPPPPSPGAVRCLSYEGTNPEVWGAVSRPPRGLGTWGRRRPVGALWLYQRPEFEVPGARPRRDTAGQIFDLRGALSPAPGGPSARGWRRLIGGLRVYRGPEFEVPGARPRRDTAVQNFELWGALSPAPGGLSARGWRRPRGADGPYQRPEFQVPRPRRSRAGPGRTSNHPLSGGLAQDGAPFPGRAPISPAAPEVCPIEDAVFTRHRGDDKSASQAELQGLFRATQAQRGLPLLGMRVSWRPLVWFSVNLKVELQGLFRSTEAQRGLTVLGMRVRWRPPTPVLINHGG